MLAPNREPATFELEVASLFGHDIVVQSFRGTEEVSRPFRFDVVCDADVGPAVVDAISLGEPACFRMSCPGGPRVVAGVVGAVSLVGVTRSGRSRLRLRVVPRVSTLRRKVSSRIFQDQTTPEIVSAVLRKARIAFRWDVKSKYAKRAYCVQHLESDFDFVTRLLAEEGIFYYFEAGAEPEPSPSRVAAAALSAISAGGAGEGLPMDILVFADSAAYPAILDDSAGPGGVDEALDEVHDVVTLPAGVATSDPAARVAAPSLRYSSDEGVVQGERVDGIEVGRAIRSSAVVLRDYDFHRPLLDLTVASAPSNPAVAKLLGLGEAANAGAPANDAALNLEAYDYARSHELLSASDPRAQRQTSARHLEQLRRRARVYRGTSNCRRIEAGRRFSLEGHVQTQFDREYVAVKVEHRGRIPEGGSSSRGLGPTYDNRFECVGSELTYRPARPARVVRQVIETAVVVGPPGKEIFTDQHGRIKVQFHWDRHGKRNEYSSCWMRTLEPWGGAAWGTQFIPRVGMEVIVGFLGGDEDRPFVLGSAYNATHPLPFRDERTSGIRTRSVGQKDGGQGASAEQAGCNELSFHDEAGHERLHLRAERDLDVHVGRNAHHHVVEDEVTSVGRHRHQEIKGDLRCDVRGTHDELSRAGRRITSDGDVRVRAGAGVRLRAGGELGLEAGTAVRVKAGQEVSAVIGRRGKQDAVGSIHVYGDQRLSADGALILSAEKGIALRCGKTCLTITHDGVSISAGATGKVALDAKSIVAKSAEGPSLSLGKDVKILSKSMRFVAEGSSVVLDENARVQGTQVKLDCDPDGEDGPSDPSTAPETQPLHLRLCDYDLKPYAGKHYEILADGTTLQGVTDGDGQIDRKVPKSAKVATVTLWPADYPTGPTQAYDVSFDKVEAASTVKGAKVRLQNLGYYRGPLDAESNEAFAAALREFQADGGLQASGSLDPDTVAKLEGLHGH